MSSNQNNGDARGDDRLRYDITALLALAGAIESDNLSSTAGEGASTSSSGQQAVMSVSPEIPNDRGLSRGAITTRGRGGRRNAFSGPSPGTARPNPATRARLQATEQEREQARLEAEERHLRREAAREAMGAAQDERRAREDERELEALRSERHLRSINEFAQARSARVCRLEGERVREEESREDLDVLMGGSTAEAMETSFEGILAMEMGWVPPR